MRVHSKNSATEKLQLVVSVSCKTKLVPPTPQKKVLDKVNLRCLCLFSKKTAEALITRIILKCIYLNFCFLFFSAAERVCLWVS